MKNYDILVVGGGPAGLSAGRATSKHGARTLIIDKKEQIGSPVKCAEGIGQYLFPSLPLQIPEECLTWKIDGMFFTIEDVTIEKKGDYWEGYTIDRQILEQWLSTKATEAGADLFLNSEINGIEIETNGEISNAIIQKSNEEIKINPEVVIAADGSESSILKMLGLYKPEPGDIGEIYSWEMKSVNNLKPRFEQIFVGEFTPGGYAYIFPKSRDVVNVGVGGLLPEKNMEKYFNEFLEIPFVKKQLKNAEFVVEKSKKSIWSDIIDDWVYKNVIFTGDSANQNIKPFVEGILPAIICGDIAGDLASQYINSKIALPEISTLYKDNIRKIFGDEIDESKLYAKTIKELFTFKNERSNIIFGGLLTGIFKLEELHELKEMNLNKLLYILRSRK